MNTNNFSIIREKTGMSIKDTATHFGKSIRTIYRWEKGDYVPDNKALNKLQHLAESRTEQYNTENKKFRFIDLFAGIGGLRKAFESMGGECVFTSEWDEFCRKTYMANFKHDHDIEGDIKNVDAADIPTHEVLLAGFPCQPFSIAGVSKKTSLGMEHGFRDNTQGTLFFDVARIIEYHKPKAFLLENVKNLLSHDKGKTFAIIIKTLEEELGYHVDYRVINAKGWVPQNRERIFIVGFKEKNDFSFDDLTIADPLNGPKLKTILHNPSEEPEYPYTEKNGTVNEKYTLSDKLWGYLQGYAEKHRKKGNGFGFGLNEPDDVARTLSARYYKDGSEILIKQTGKNPRRITPRECARIMGFDMSEEKTFKIPVSDTQAYKQFGNSVVVPVVEKVAYHMLPYILENGWGSPERKQGQMDIFSL